MQGEQAQIEAVVRAFFADPSPPSEDLLWGPTLEWARLRGRQVDEFERAREVRRVEALDVRGDTATAALDALERVRHPKGVREHRYRFSGPVVLERVDGRWRLVDWAFQGRRRLESLVLGLLAEQTHGDVTVRVLGVDRLSVATRAIVEVENRSSDPAEVRRAFVGRRRWVPGWCVPSDPVSPRRRARREIGVAHGFQVGAELDVALELRVGERRLGFDSRCRPRPPTNPSVLGRRSGCRPGSGRPWASPSRSRSPGSAHSRGSQVGSR